MMDRNATFWQRAMVYFACMESLVWWITVPNVNKISPFFPAIYDISGTWYLIMVLNMKEIQPAIMEESAKMD